LLPAHESDPDDPVDGADERSISRIRSERLSDREEAKDRRVLADVAEVTPIEPLLRIPEAEENKYENAADNYSGIRAFEQFPHLACRSISDYLPRRSHPGFHQVICFL
jgi:hypothetical protein